jgi:ribosomal protein S10
MNIQIIVKALDKTILFFYLNFLVFFFKKIHFKNFSIQNLPTKKKRLTLLKSPHVNKKAKEQFELKIYKTAIYINNIKTKNFLKFLIFNKPKNIKLKFKIFYGKVI